jgi:hypothetical protein
MTRVMSSLDAGAEMMTFLAPPSTWALALVASVKKPVDSMTMSAPTLAQSSLAGSRSAQAANFLPLAVIEALVVGHVAREAPEDRVVLEQVREALVVSEVVNGHDLDVSAGLDDGAVEVAPDAAEAVNANLDGHCDLNLPTGVDGHAHGQHLDDPTAVSGSPWYRLQP